jgi:hypothetical protein
MIPPTSQPQLRGRAGHLHETTLAGNATGRTKYEFAQKTIVKGPGEYGLRDHQGGDKEVGQIC